MHNTTKPNPQPHTTEPAIWERSSALSDLLNLRVDHWIPTALSIAKNHYQHINELRSQAPQKVSGRDLAYVLKELDGFAVMHMAIETPAAPAQPKPLHDSLIDIAETIAARAEQCSQSSTAIVGDVELARIAVGLKQSNPFRVWLVALQLVRETGQKRILRADVEAALPRYGIRVSERNLRRWLHRGHGLYWNVTDKYLYFAGYETLAKRLTRIASDLKPDLVRTNQPGRLRYMHIDVAGSLAQFEAHVYAAWLAARENPTIARSTLAALFNRMPKILRQWEKLAGVEVVTNEAQFHPDHIGDVPDHARLYRAGIGDGYSEDHWRARMVNTYHAPKIRQHPKRGQGRRVYRAVTEILESIESAGNCGQVQTVVEGCTGGLNPTGKRYFSDSQHARQSVKRTGKIRTRFVELGSEDRNTYLWEYSPDGRQRTRKTSGLRSILSANFILYPCMQRMCYMGNFSLKNRGADKKYPYFEAHKDIYPPVCADRCTSGNQPPQNREIGKALAAAAGGVLL